MAWAALSDMVARFTERALVQLADADEWDAGAQAVVTDKLASATLRAQAYLARRYKSVDAIAIPQLVKAMVCDIAYYELHTDPPANVVSRFNQALRDLADVRDGKITVDQGDVDAIEERPGAVIVSGPERIFSHDSLKGF